MSGGTFRYTARNADGERVAGSMYAADSASVLNLLRGRALFVTRVSREHDIVDRLRQMLPAGSISHAALLAFFRSFATLIRAGVSIQRSLRITIERAADDRLREALRATLADVEAGSPLSDAMARRPRDFAPLYVAMIKAGEAGGILDEVLERLAQLLEREAALRKSVRTALTYPVIVLLAAGTLVVFLLAKIVPMFAQMFVGFHVDLPPATALLLRLGDMLSAPLTWAIFAVTILAAGALVYRIGRTARGALAIDNLRLRLPLAGPLLRKVIMARSSRMLGTLLRSGVELTAAIEAVVPVSGSTRYANAFTALTASLRAGEPLAAALELGAIFDPLFVALVRVGEETGLVDEMLLKVADYFESDVAATIATLGAAIEPILILVLGGIVGFIVFSIFLPLYSLVGAIH